MTARSWYSIANRAADSAEVWIFDEIGEGGIGAEQFCRDLQALRAVKNLTLRINSPGGCAFSGVAIYNALARHQARKTVWVDGIAASIASVIAMAGNEIRIPENAIVMIHDPYALCMGTAEDMRITATALDKVKTSLVSAYKRCGQTEDTIRAWMRDETWFTGVEAVNAGLADRLEQPVKIAARFDLGKFNYRHPPQPSPADAWSKVINSKFAKAGA